MPLDAEPILYTLRWYDEHWGYNRKLPYKAVATVSILNKDTAHITAMHGEMNATMYKELVSWLDFHNIKKVEVFRHDKLRTYSVEDYRKYL
jgi:hypothetical protein